MIQPGGHGQMTGGGAERDTEAEVAGVSGCRFIKHNDWFLSSSRGIVLQKGMKRKQTLDKAYKQHG